MLLGCCLMLVGAGCVGKTEFHPDTPSGGGGEPGEGTAVVSVRYLNTAYTGYPTPVTKDWEVQGVVTANDRYGSFPNALVVQSGTDLYRSRFILDKETSEKVTFPVRGRNIAGNHHAPFAGDRHGVALIKRAERRDTHRRNGHIGRMRFRRVEPVIIASPKATRQGQQPRSCCQTQQTEPSAGSKPDMETTISHQNRKFKVR